MSFFLSIVDLRLHELRSDDWTGDHLDFDFELDFDLNLNLDSTDSNNNLDSRVLMHMMDYYTDVVIYRNQLMKLDCIQLFELDCNHRSDYSLPD